MIGRCGAAASACRVSPTSLAVDRTQHKAHTHASPHPWLPREHEVCFCQKPSGVEPTLLSAGTHTSLGSESTGSLVFSDLIAERGEVQYTIRYTTVHIPTVP